VRGHPWSKLASAMKAVGTENADYRAWLTWCESAAPKAFAQLKLAPEADLLFTELYTQFTKPKDSTQRPTGKQS